MRSREEREQWYGRPDPWRTEGSDDELFRAEAICSRLRDRGLFRHAHFDLVVTAEVLYYLQTDAERREAIAGIAGIRKRGASNSQSTH